MTPKPESETDPWKAAEDAVYDPFCEAEEAWGIVDAARAAEAAQHQQEIAAKDQRIRQEVAISNRLRVSWNEDVGAARAESEQLACEIEAMGSRAEQAIAALHARLAAVEAERDALERLRVHCEHCGADYAATGVEAGCPCLVRAERDRLKAAFLELHATVKGECPSLLDPDRGGSDVLWALCAAALTPQGQSTDGETK